MAHSVPGDDRQPERENVYRRKLEGYLEVELVWGCMYGGWLYTILISVHSVSQDKYIIPLPLG